MDFSMVVSEDRIKRAYKDGEFENLPGYGKPLILEDLSAVPEHLRMAYKMLKNAGFSPEEQRLRQEVMSIEDLIRTCENPEEKNRLNQELSANLLKYNKIMSSRGARTNSSIFKNYERKIEKKLL
jgi:hypothetical protein